MEKNLSDLTDLDRVMVVGASLGLCFRNCLDFHKQSSELTQNDVENKMHPVMHYR